MERTVKSLERELARVRTRLHASNEKLRASNATLSDEGTKLRFDIAELFKDNAGLRDRNATYLLRLKQEEQCREGWQARALKAETELEEA